MFEEDDLSDLEDYRPRNPWPARILALFALMAISCCAGAFVFLRDPPTNANRMLVAIHVETLDGGKVTWWDPEAHKDVTARRVHDAVVKGLETIDLEIVSRETPRALEALAGADSVKSQKRTAGKLGAAWLLTGAVKTTSATPIADTDWSEYTYETHLQLVPTTGSAAPVDLPSPIRFRARGRTETDGVSSIAMEIAKLATPPALDALSEQERMQHYAEAEGLPVEEQIMADQLRRFFRYASDRREALQAHQEREEQGADIERQRGLDPERRIGPWLTWEVFLGPTADDRILLKIDELRPELPITERTVELVEIHETLVLANPDGSDRELLFDAYNFYGWPRVSEDGKWVTGVLDERGLALTMIAISLPDGEVHRLASHEEEEYSTPIVSPDGQQVAYWWQPCRGCTMELRVMPLEGGEPTTVHHNVEGTGGHPVWSPDSDALVVSIDPPGRPGSVWRVAVPSGEKELLAGVGDRQRGPGYTLARLSPDGSFVAVAERDTKGDEHLAILDLATGELDRVYHGEIDKIAISPDSSKVALCFQRKDGWDWEVGVVDARSGAFEQLTRSSRTDYLGGWSRDASTVYSMQDEHAETQFYRTYANPVGI